MYFQQLLKTYGLDPEVFDFSFDPVKNNNQCHIIPFPIERAKKKQITGKATTAKVIPLKSKRQ